MATVTGSSHLVLHFTIESHSPITVTGSSDLDLVFTITSSGSAFSLIPVDAGSLILTPVTPASLGPLVPA